MAGLLVPALGPAALREVADVHVGGPAAELVKQVRHGEHQVRLRRTLGHCGGRSQPAVAHALMR